MRGAGLSVIDAVLGNTEGAADRSDSLRRSVMASLRDESVSVRARGLRILNGHCGEVGPARRHEVLDLLGVVLREADDRQLLAMQRTFIAYMLRGGPEEGLRSWPGVSGRGRAEPG